MADILHKVHTSFYLHVLDWFISTEYILVANIKLRDSLLFLLVCWLTLDSYLESSLLKRTFTLGHGFLCWQSFLLTTFGLDIRAGALLKWFNFPSEWLKNLAPLFHSMIKPKPIVTRSHTVSIGSLDCLCPLWLARVITLVLVLRHSIEKKRKKKPV